MDEKIKSGKRNKQRKNNQTPTPKVLPSNKVSPGKGEDRGTMSRWKGKVNGRWNKKVHFVGRIGPSTCHKGFKAQINNESTQGQSKQQVSPVRRVSFLTNKKATRGSPQKMSVQKLVMKIKKPLSCSKTR